MNGSFWIIPYTVDTHRVELYLTDALATARQIEKGKIKGDYSMTPDPDMEDQDASPADCIDNPRIDADECEFTATALVRGSAAQTRARLHPGSGLVHPQPIVLQRGVLPTDQKTLHKAIQQ